MPSDLQVSNIKDLTGSNTGLSIASDGQVTIAQNNPTIELGSNATFPAGMIIKKSLIAYADAVSPIYTSSTSFTDTGVGGSFTVKNASTNSYLKFTLYQGMTHVSNGSTSGEIDFCLTTSSNTSHSNGNSLYGSQTYKNWTQYNGGSWYGRYSTAAIYRVGTRVTTNLTSYSAGDTLYIRIFMKASNTSANHFFAHSNSHYFLEAEEISI